MLCMLIQWYFSDQYTSHTETQMYCNWITEKKLFCSLCLLSINFVCFVCVCASVCVRVSGLYVCVYGHHSISSMKEHDFSSWFQLIIQGATLVVHATDFRHLLTDWTPGMTWLMETWTSPSLLSLPESCLLDVHRGILGSREDEWRVRVKGRTPISALCQGSKQSHPHFGWPCCISSTASRE